MDTPKPNEVFKPKGLHNVVLAAQEAAQVLMGMQLPMPDLKEELCEMDSRPVQVMSFKGTGVCSELCRKLRDGEISAAQHLELRAIRRDLAKRS